MISIWEKETFYAPQDVVIAGGGLVGLWSAFYLKKKKPKLRVTLVDRGLIPTGASTRNAGFACFGSLSEVVHDAQAMGADKMLELVEMRYKGLERIQKYFDDATIDFDLCGGYELYEPSDQLSSEQLQHNITYINSLFKPVTGSKKTYRLADAKIEAFGFGHTKHLVKNNLEGRLHSGKLVQALISKVQGMGVQVFNQTEIRSFASRGDRIELQTNQNMTLLASQLLVCTNAFAKELLPEADVVPARGQVLLTSPINGLPWKGTFHSDEGFYYFRNLGNKVLLGGARNKAFADETTTDMNISPFIQSELETYLKQVILPHCTEPYHIEQRWAGIMAMGSEKMPIIKEVQPRIFCAVRMSGMGVALSPVVAQRVTDMITA
jgi:glycine/D-amino acid oxidase-like deaminating enzyme